MANSSTFIQEILNYALSAGYSPDQIEASAMDIAKEYLSAKEKVMDEITNPETATGAAFWGAAFAKAEKI